MPRTLTPREVLFCECVAKGMVPTLAARKAGYSDKGGHAATVAATRLMKRDDILAMIAKFQRKPPSKAGGGAGGGNGGGGTPPPDANGGNGGGVSPPDGDVSSHVSRVLARVSPDVSLAAAEMAEAAARAWDGPAMTPTRQMAHNLLVEAYEYASGRKAKPTAQVIKESGEKGQAPVVHVIEKLVRRADEALMLTTAKLILEEVRSLETNPPPAGDKTIEGEADRVHPLTAALEVFRKLGIGQTADQHETEEA